MKGQVYSLWFWRKGEDGPELLTAWDEWSVDGNIQGWRDDCEKRFAEVSEDDSGYGPREIRLTFDFERVEEAFYPDDVPAEASNQERRPE